VVHVVVGAPVEHVLLIKRLRDPVRPGAALVICKCPARDTAKGTGVLLSQRGYDLAGEFIQRKVPGASGIGSDGGADQQLRCACRTGDGAVPGDLGAGRLVIRAVVVELAVEPGDIIARRLEYLRVGVVIASIRIKIGRLRGVGDDVVARRQVLGEPVRQVDQELNAGVDAGAIGAAGESIIAVFVVDVHSAEAVVGHEPGYLLH
jgi:hypothetical protein